MVLGHLIAALSAASKKRACRFDSIDNIILNCVICVSAAIGNSWTSLKVYLWTSLVAVERGRGC